MPHQSDAGLWLSPSIAECPDRPALSGRGDTLSRVLCRSDQLPPRVPRYSSTGWAVPRVNYKSMASQTPGVSDWRPADGVQAHPPLDRQPAQPGDSRWSCSEPACSIPCLGLDSCPVSSQQRLKAVAATHRGRTSVRVSVPRLIPESTSFLCMVRSRMWLHSSEKTC